MRKSGLHWPDIKYYCIKVPCRIKAYQMPLTHKQKKKRKRMFSLFEFKWKAISRNFPVFLFECILQLLLFQFHFERKVFFSANFFFSVERKFSHQTFRIVKKKKLSRTFETSRCLLYRLNLAYVCCVEKYDIEAFEKVYCSRFNF